MKIDAPYAGALPVGHVVRESLSGGSKCRGEIGSNRVQIYSCVLIY